MILDDDISQKAHNEKEDEEDAMSSSSGISSSSFSNSSVYNRERTEKMLDEILEDEKEDEIFDEDIDESSISCMDNIEEVKRINGRCITKSPDKNKQLIRHIGTNDCLDNMSQLNRNSIVRR